MLRVQLSIRDAGYAAALRESLERSGVGEVCGVELPDPDRESVIVIDADTFERLPLPLPQPERVVLITRNDPEQLSRAWEAGIRSVVFCNDPLNTAVLAIMAAGLRRCSDRAGVSENGHCRPPSGESPQRQLERHGRKTR